MFTVDVQRKNWYLAFMLCSFSCKHTEQLFHGGRVPRFQAFARQAEKRLQILDSATCIDDLINLPSNRFEVLSGDRKGQQSIRINQQWRICFEWQEDGPHNVEIVDYH
ncbi:MAG: type II toxin-antitoxin system RelE/ParE family toxin [Desulfurivibrionaceae bacterium]